MKISLIVSFYFFICMNVFAQDFEWANRMGGASEDIGKAITIDANGAIYSTGSFRYTVDFDPGTGVFDLVSLSASQDLFVQKLDANGNFVWAKQIGGTGADSGNGIGTDNNGNVYIVGSFQGTVDFDPGTAVFNLTSSSGSSDIFVQKLDVNGNFVWAKSMGSAGTDIGEAISVDGLGNVHITGGFRNTVDFNPGGGTFNLTATGDLDIFVQKLDANGNFVWAKGMGSNSRDNGYGITVVLKIPVV